MRLYGILTPKVFFGFSVRLLSIIFGRKIFSFIKKQSFFKLFSIVITIFALKQSYFCEIIKLNNYEC